MGQLYDLGLPCLDMAGPDSSRWPHQAFYGNLIKTDWWKPGLENGAAWLSWRYWGHFTICLSGLNEFIHHTKTYSRQGGTVILRKKNTKKPRLDTHLHHLLNTGTWQFYQINGLSLKTCNCWISSIVASALKKCWIFACCRKTKQLHWYKSNAVPWLCPGLCMPYTCCMSFWGIQIFCACGSRSSLQI